MANLEVNRRTIGRDIIQKYVTDDEEGGAVTGTATVQCNSSYVFSTPVNLGFKPSYVLWVVVWLTRNSGYDPLNPYSAMAMYDSDLGVRYGVTEEVVYRAIDLITSTGFTIAGSLDSYS